MTRLFYAHKFLTTVFVLICLGIILCGYLWMQHRYEAIATEKAALVRQISDLRGQVVLRELENKELSSLDRIAKVAPLLGLDYAQVPRKIKKVGDR